ncbi:MAG: alpha/beta hydrolase domain-containing protein, partial [Algiphilus sp.]
YRSTACGLGGITLPLTRFALRQRYPTHADYVARMQEATDATVAAGYLLPEDAAELMERAKAAAPRWPLDLLQRP